MSSEIAAVEKTFKVLETMSQLERPATLKELSVACGFPKATLFRILQTLVKLGYVDQDHVGSRYALTLRMYDLGRGSGHEDLRQAALPIMQSLHDQFDETVNLGVLEGLEILYIHYIETTHALRWQVRPGVRDPFHCTALGRAIVAHMSPERQEKLLQRIAVDPRTTPSPKSREDVERILAETRERGWAIDDEENEIGVVCFGVPIFDDGLVVGGLSVSVVKGRLTPVIRDNLIAALLAHSARDQNTGSPLAAVGGRS